MKFSQIAPGQRFRYKGTLYTKSGPIQAIPEGGTKAQMIAKSAVVEVESREQPQPAPGGRIVRMEWEGLLEAIDAYHRECLEIAGGGAEEQLAAARSRLLDGLQRLRGG